MDFSFTEEQEKLRKEVHDYYIKRLPADFQGNVYPISKELQVFMRDLEKETAAKGWLTPGWPKEYGGVGLSEMEQGIVAEEQGYWDFYWPNTIGFRMAGPALLLYGTDDQKRKFLPPISRGDVIWWQAFTEPNAGSDEANVQLRAAANGDDFILNGQKTFISGSGKPDFLYTLARTADTVPKHRGLTIFLIPADTPGITYRGFQVLGGRRAHEIFFDDVKVSKNYLLGELNRGFREAMATLEYERSNPGLAAGAKRNLEEFVQYCKETKRNGKPLIEDPQVRDILAQMAIEVEIWRLFGWRTTWRFSQRKQLGPLDYDLNGLWRKMRYGAHAKWMMDIMGEHGQLKAGSKWAKLGGSIQRRWDYTRSLHGGGTIDILKGIIAERVLGLPRKR